MKTVLTPADFSAEDFIIDKDVDDGKSVIKINRGNAVIAQEMTGITTIDAELPDEKYIKFSDKSGHRRRLQVQGNFGILHLDFTAQTRGGSQWTLPEGSPTPRSLIEVQTRDGGTVFMTANSRNIRWQALTVGSRYVVDIVGFWNIPG